MSGDVEILKKIKEKEDETSKAIARKREELEETLRKKGQEKNEMISREEAKLKKDLEESLDIQSGKLREKSEAAIAEARKKSQSLKLKVSDSDLRKMVDEGIRNILEKD